MYSILYQSGTFMWDHGFMGVLFITRYVISYTLAVTVVFFKLQMNVGRQMPAPSKMFMAVWLWH